MAKRFTDTGLWKDQRWFRKLSPTHKLAFCYIKDQCNHAGLWKIDCSDLIEDLGLDSFDFEVFIASINTEYDKTTGAKILKDRIIVVKNFLWITGFIQFQYENKAKEVSISAPVKTAFLNYIGLDILHTSVSKGYVTLTKDLIEKYVSLNDNLLTLTKELQSGYTTAKDKDKDKDKDTSKGIENKKGKSFDENFEYVFFEDGTKQKLGSEQKALAEKGNIKPLTIIKGSIY